MLLSLSLFCTTRYAVVIPCLSAALTEEEHENVMWYTYLEFLAKAVQGESDASKTGNRRQVETALILGLATKAELAGTSGPGRFLCCDRVIEGEGLLLCVLTRKCSSQRVSTRVVNGNGFHNADLQFKH